jgi:predicted restriction endonuclease
VNLASLDPAITGTGRKGLGHASASDRRIWQEFHDVWTVLAEESGEILQQLGFQETEGAFGPGQTPPAGPTSVEALVQVRRGQDFFRRTVLASDGGRCCMSGLAEPGLLLASHIVPWASDAENRLNPKIGLCLSALHDPAFDKGLIAVDTEYCERVSPVLRVHGKNDLARTWLLDLEGVRIRLPERFLPDREFLAWHLGTLFQAG